MSAHPDQSRSAGPNGTPFVASDHYHAELNRSPEHRVEVRYHSKLPKGHRGRRCQACGEVIGHDVSVLIEEDYGVMLEKLRWRAYHRTCHPITVNREFTKLVKRIEAGRWGA